MNPVARYVNQSFIYLATPYRAHPKGRRRAYEDACRLTCRLMRWGVKVFCPIAHAHGPSEYGLDPIDHQFWMRFDKPFMDAASLLLVAKLPGWENSSGIAEEMDYFKAQNKHVVMWDDVGGGQDG